MASVPDVRVRTAEDEEKRKKSSSYDKDDKKKRDKDKKKQEKKKKEEAKRDKREDKNRRLDKTKHKTLLASFDRLRSISDTLYSAAGFEMKEDESIDIDMNEEMSSSSTSPSGSGEDLRGRRTSASAESVMLSTGSGSGDSLDLSFRAGMRGRSPESSTSSSATMEKGGETGGDGAPREHLSESSPDEEVLTSPSLSYVKMQSMPTSRSLDILSDNSAASRRGRFLTRRATEYPIQLNEVSSDEDEDESGGTDEYQAERLRQGALELVDPSKPPPESREQRLKKFYRRFKELPDEVPIQTFVCALAVKNAFLVQGCMYITQHYAVFYATVLRKKVRAKCHFKDITYITKKRTALVVPNAIEIGLKDGRSYFWASFMHRDRAHEMLIAQWKVICPESTHRVGVEEFVHNSLRETTHADMKLLANVRGIQVDAPDPDEVDDDDDLDDMDGEEIDMPPSSTKCIHSVEETSPMYTKHQTFNITVKKFYEMFFSPKGQYFWQEFHSRDGYSEYASTPWITTDDQCCIERQVSFRALTRVPFGPKSTRIVQTHHCRKSGDSVIFETSSVSKDVPYSGTFLVESIWTVSPSEKGCKLSIAVFVRFVKKTWLRSMIEKNAAEASHEWFDSWIRLAKEVSETPGDKRHVFASSGEYTTAQKIQTLRTSADINEELGRAEVPTTRMWANEVMVSAAADGKLMWVLIAIIAVLSLVCLGLLWHAYSTTTQLEEMEREKSKFESKYTFLQNALSSAIDRYPESSEELQNLWNYWKAGGKLSKHVQDWKQLVAAMELNLKAAKEKFVHFQPPSPTLDPEFVKELGRALEVGDPSAK